MKTHVWDAATHLKTEADMAAYLEVALEEDDPQLIMAVLGDIARAKGINQISNEIGIDHENLFNLLSSEAHPEFATILKLIRALGLQLHASVA